MFDILKKKLKDSVAKITKAVTGKEEAKDEPKIEEAKQEATEPKLEEAQNEKHIDLESPALPEPIPTDIKENAPILIKPEKIEDISIKETADVMDVTVEDNFTKEIAEDVKEKANELDVGIKNMQRELEEIHDDVKFKTPELETKLPEPIEELKPEVKEKPKRGFLKKIFSRDIELAETDIAPILDDMVLDLAEGDVALEVGEKITSDLRKSLIGASVGKKEVESFVMESLESSLENIFNSAQKVDLVDTIEKCKKENRPCVITFIGFNGAGKTTSLAKLGQYLKDKGYTTIFAAADTFRAASIEQLEEHGRRIGTGVIKHKYGSDSAAVIYDAIQHAKARGINVVLADTAGRSHANSNLMDELRKIFRVNKIDLKILVIDSLTGNDATEQAINFNQGIGIDAIVLTKTDVNPKGGAALSVVHAIKRPILFMGTGQTYNDIKLFNSTTFIQSLLK